MVRLRATLLINYYTNTKLNEYTGPTQDCSETHKIPDWKNRSLNWSIFIPSVHQIILVTDQSLK